MGMEFFTNASTGWWVSQFIVCVSLVFTALAFVQKSREKILILNTAAIILALAASFFLKEVSVIIMFGVSASRNLFALFLAFKVKGDDRLYRVAAIGVLIPILVILNVIFWDGALSLLSMVIGATFTIALLQSNPKIIRFGIVFGESLSIIYFSIIFIPINIIAETIGLTSAIIGILKHDIKWLDTKRE